MERLGARNEIIGAFAGIEYHNARTHLGAGDTLLLYTDGITETPHRTGSLYGLDRLQARLGYTASRPLDALCAALLVAIQAWCANE